MLQDSLHTKLEHLSERLQEIEGLLAEPDVLADQNRFRELSREYAGIKPIVGCYQRYHDTLAAIESAREMAADPDREIRSMAADELETAETRAEELENELKILLLPRDPADDGNVFLEIRAGTGGDEAALFAGDLARMYLQYAEQRGWQTEIISSAESEAGGYKEIIIRIIGQGAYSRLKFESGAHRVQRVPATESQGRIHTSACTVAVLPEVESVDEEDIEINPSDLRIDTFRASGAGGQHVNKTDSAIRITHLPSGIVVESQSERSQHKNRAQAMSFLHAKLFNAERDKQLNEQSEARRLLVGSGDRSERIRTYNFPQGRITDHRINLTLYKLENFIQGDLDSIIDPLISEYQADQLAALGQQQG
ncbi:peptide chain release factor 1 [Methylohalomonas lacus]|uniref:Peptide chain release factor 1 n=1 Tax=Methylohalomonas lacus TaxID=398773 RepID=A0AAE3L0I4_9GAMM|nr:peptide chain release factor 1 [Methylohalomonas lacus]MCS3902080.1 peptide chain release factor 1 [Methylohalomonas lacus]